MSNLPSIEVLLDLLTDQLKQLIDQRNLDKPLMIGIHTGGVWVAKELHQRLGLEDPLGSLNITFYRDDFTQIGLHPTVAPSHLPFEIDERNIILVDDVIYSGRTIRAALNEIFDYGRPANVVLATLLDRDGRQLPFQPDVSAAKLNRDQYVKLTGPEPLSLQETL